MNPARSPRGQSPSSLGYSAHHEAAQSTDFGIFGISMRLGKLAEIPLSAAPGRKARAIERIVAVMESPKSITRILTTEDPFEKYTIWLSQGWRLHHGTRT